jgi:adenosylcobinamide-phosphate synthase
MEFLPSWYILPAAFVLDLILGDPQSLPHPVRWMGKAIEAFEPFFRKIPCRLLISGALFSAFHVLTTGVSVLLILHAAHWIHPLAKNCFEIILIYYCISVRSLEDAAMEIHRYLLEDRLKAARKKIALIVGRDVDNYEAQGISRAVVETVAENLVDGVIAPLFFAAIGGAPLAMVYKMINTLDSMIGYKNERYMFFGKASARLDDILNLIPSRLSVPIISLATQILSGKGRRSLKTAFTEGANHSSPNAGYPEAAFAGALAVKLNGPNYYNGQLVHKPYIGVRFGNTVPEDIKKACQIMILSSFLWFLIAWATSAVIGVFF